MIRHVTVGPLPIYFGNRNDAMQLKGHYHTAQVTLVYGHRQGDHGYPSFEKTNDELRALLKAHTGTKNMFKDATNEDVAEQLFRLVQDFTGPEARKYGGSYWLEALHLDVEGVHDDIGHDNGTTRYTIALANAHSQSPYVLSDQRIMLPAEVD